MSFGWLKPLNELQVAVGRLEDGIEAFQHVAVTVLQFGIGIEYVQNGLVVLVNQNHGAAACLPVGGFEHLHKAASQIQYTLSRR